MKLRKILSLLIAVVLCFGSIHITHAEEQPLLSAAVPQFQSAAPQANDWLDGIDRNTLIQELRQKLFQLSASIDISKYNIPNECITEFLTFMRDEIPEAFHVDYSDGVSYHSGAKYLVSVDPDYLYSKGVYEQKLAEINAVARRMTADLKDLPQVKQALLIHDRLALACYYPDAPYSDHDFTMYGALISGRAVCQGYALAYKYLLNQVGIENELCSSDILEHAWNIVTIDGRQYHVDVTWDDPWNIDGIVWHNNFLRSTAGIIETGHHADDFNSAPTDTTYDNAFWKDYDTAFVKLRGSELYYIDLNKAAVCRYSDRQKVLELGTMWPAENGYYSGCYSILAADGMNLLYSQYGTVYRFDPVTGIKEAVFTPSHTEPKTLNIYGLKLEGTTLRCTLSDVPYPIAETDFTRVITTEYTLPLPFTTADAVTVMQYLIGMDVELDLSIMDRDQDEIITISDAVLILRALAA
ncbi:MAG: hypothetical protein IKM48_01460 [Clostridia bacterium]|nr:hypothetical protein [Clostridia bacterium]